MSNIIFIGRKMEKKEALKLIRGGQAKVWNKYRQDNPDWEQDLSYEDLSSCRLKLQDGSYFDFSKANLCGTKFSEDWAYMTRALKNAKFNADTKFPLFFDPNEYGAVFVRGGGKMDYRDCPYCKGTGRDPFALELCPVCKGSGRLRAFPEEQSVKCRFCEEEGRDPYRDAPCRKCKGHGVIYAGPIECVYISGEKPYSDRRTIEEILKQVTGEVRICETYFGNDTLDLLRNLPDTCTVRVLIGKNTDVSSKLSREIRAFRTERPRFKFRHYKQPGLHDRYLVDDGRLIILGHGLKDIGKKESFAIFLEKSLVPTIISENLKAFEDRWNSATPI